MNRERIGPALGKIASGLYVATAYVESQPVGMLCSFVEQCGFEPPMISIAIAPGRPISPVLDAQGVFGLHILSRENNALMKAFARGDNPAAFAELGAIDQELGIPQFTEAFGFLACRAVGRLAAGDHILYVAEVLDGVLQRPEGEPMIRVRANGFGY